MIWRKTVEVEKWSNLSTARVVARDRGILDQNRYVAFNAWTIMNIITSYSYH